MSRPDDPGAARISFGFDAKAKSHVWLVTLAEHRGLRVKLDSMTDEGFAAVERRIRAHQGEQFFTRSGLPMTYVVEGDRIKVDRATPWLSMASAKEIWAMGPGTTLTDVDQRITGRAYLFAILCDPRIAS